MSRIQDAPGNIRGDQTLVDYNILLLLELCIYIIIIYICCIQRLCNPLQLNFCISYKAAPEKNALYQNQNLFIYSLYGLLFVWT